MKKEHFEYLESCESTQDIVKEKLISNSDDQYLVVSRYQSKGRGRTGNHWISTGNSLAMSFDISANEVFTLTSLEIGSLVVKYFCETLKSAPILLKWPNDLFQIDRKKIAGILCESFQGKIVVGVGINLFQSSEDQDLFGYLFSEKPKQSIEELSKNLWHFILNNRMKPIEVIQYFESNCIHMNKNVKIDSVEGKFIGIGKSGEALLEINNAIVPVFAGSLLF